MHIVQQSATFSYSLIPPYPLLVAPPALLALPAPKPIIVIERHYWVDDVLEALGPFQSKEEMDDELMEIVDRMVERTIKHRMRRAEAAARKVAQ